MHNFYICNVEEKLNLFNIPDLNTVEEGTDEYVLARLANELEKKNEEVKIILKEKGQEIHELKVEVFGLIFRLQLIRNKVYCLSKEK